MDYLCQKTEFFKNPRKLPLNELYFDYKKLIRTAKDEVTVDIMLKEIEKPQERDKWNNRYEVKVEKKTAIDKCWIQEEKRYVKFQPFYPQFEDSENEQFFEKNQEFLEILEHLVDCTYHQFWCYIACEPRVSFIIKDFLQHSIPLYAVIYLNEEFLQLYDEIYSCICSIYQRLFKFKLSEVEYMSEEFVMGILKNTELLSVRSILSLCYLYNSSNPEFIKGLMDFFLVDKYKEQFCKDTTDMLSEALEELNNFGDDSLNGEPSLITDSGRRYNSERFDPVWLEETSSYLLEMSAALHEFLSVCKPAVEIAITLEIPHRIPHIYQKIYAYMYEMLDNKTDVGYDWSRYETLINQWLKVGRSEFVNLFHVFTFYYTDTILDIKEDRQQQENHLEMYIRLISVAMDDDLFMKDYNRSYPVSVQFQMLVDNIPDFDKTQTDYLLNNLEVITTEPENVTVGEHIIGIAEQTSAEPFPQDLYEEIYDTLSEYSKVRSACNASNSESGTLPEPVAIAIEKFAQLKEQWKANPNCWQINPEPISDDLEQERLDEESELVKKPSEEEIERYIQAVLEMLPDLGSGFILKCLERMNYEPEQVIARVLDDHLPRDLEELPRHLIRGTSESFDMPGPSRIAQKISKPKIALSSDLKVIGYTGKKPGYSDAKQLLDDKKEKAFIKSLVLKASYAYEVDDDYDDRNEIYNPFENDDESKIYRHLKQPEFREYNAVSDPSSSSEDETKTAKPSNAFCEDPAVLRERRAAQRGRVFRGTPRNVVGRPKGQGQEQSVQHNRDKKNVQKSSRANHNRKGGAQFKRNKGMIPS